MKIGVTATRAGLSPAQLDVAHYVFTSNDVEELHHGDCVGGDAELHDVLLEAEPDARVVIHPPDDPRHRAYCAAREGDAVLEEKYYTDRNHDIVDAADVVVAFPSSGREKVRSGTWATIRYARKLAKPLVIVYPTGTQSREGVETSFES